MIDIVTKLREGGYSCVIKNNNEIRQFTQRGVSDLYDLLKSDTLFLNGASVADKVVGRAAATLMVIGGVKHLYTDIISKSALYFLKSQNVNVEFKEEVSYIKNRDFSDICPLETICDQQETIENIFPLIETFIEKARAHR